MEVIGTNDRTKSLLFYRIGIECEEKKAAHLYDENEQMRIIRLIGHANYVSK